MAISSTSLFHYTKGGLSILMKILETGFRINYSQELHPVMIAGTTYNDYDGVSTPNPGPDSIALSPRVDYLHIPMVCFCDIRFSAITEHLENYGTEIRTGDTTRQKTKKGAYAIGLSKEWAKRKGLTPILYLAHRSKLAIQLARELVATPLILNREVSSITYANYFPPVPLDDSHMVTDNNGFQFPYTFLYAKPIQETKYISGGIFRIDNYYQDEKEWRYVPSTASIISSYRWTRSSHNVDLYRTVRENAERAMEAAYPMTI